MYRNFYYLKKIDLSQFRETLLFKTRSKILNRSFSNFPLHSKPPEIQREKKVYRIFLSFEDNRYIAIFFRNRAPKGSTVHFQIFRCIQNFSQFPFVRNPHPGKAEYFHRENRRIRISPPPSQKKMAAAIVDRKKRDMATACQYER